MSPTIYTDPHPCLRRHRPPPPAPPPATSPRVPAGWRAGCDAPAPMLYSDHSLAPSDSDGDDHTPPLDYHLTQHPAELDYFQHRTEAHKPPPTPTPLAPLPSHVHHEPSSLPPTAPQAPPYSSAASAPLPDHTHGPHWDPAQIFTGIPPRFPLGCTPGCYYLSAPHLTRKVVSNRADLTLS